MIMDQKKIVQIILKYVPVSIGIAISFTLFIGACHLYNINMEHRTFILEDKQKIINKLNEDEKYTKQASTLMDYYYKENVCMRFQTVKSMLKAIDKYLPSYFPEGPFDREDFIALALTETANFDQYTIGNCGEYGLFQVMPDMCKAMGVKKNHFDIYVNTELAMFVLKEKYKKHQNYYKTIIAYNGVIVNPQTKRWRDKYWKRFLNYRKDVDIIFGEE